MTTQITRRTMLKQACGITLGGAAAVAGLNLKDAVAQQPSYGAVPVAVTDVATGVVSNALVTDLVATLDRAAGAITLSGALTDLNGVVQDTFSALVTNLAEGASCDILFLDIAPIELNLLGLEVLLSQIVLDVNAIQGDGNLLGNLLCAVTGLLDNPGGSLSGITNLLNRIFSILG